MVDIDYHNPLAQRLLCANSGQICRGRKCLYCPEISRTLVIRKIRKATALEGRMRFIKPTVTKALTSDLP
ncbi:hypothetical protein GR138_12475 [Shinella kummerowiae]|uniref:Uncharacterized protein n=1 Tax=Shinella kummerowiae TaxID=417745 RepID=A0A6N8SAB0_9HYPH|nr:hypothetical protein [Shinella kummerowiae]MXN46005.1 hypothetical protein [Shinella kummerowiae]